jgi:hypothetical protein
MTNVATVTRILASASRFPTQFMGPSENGAIALLSLTSSGRLYQRSGINSVARGKMRSSVMMRQKIYQVVTRLAQLSITLEIIQILFTCPIYDNSQYIP